MNMRSSKDHDTASSRANPSAFWLNIAEIELSALTRQSLDRRIDDLDVLNTGLAAWQKATNADQQQVNWQFTTDDARIKLRPLYRVH